MATSWRLEPLSNYVLAVLKVEVSGDSDSGYRIVRSENLWHVTSLDPEVASELAALPGRKTNDLAMSELMSFLH